MLQKKMGNSCAFHSWNWKVHCGKITYFLFFLTRKKLILKLCCWCYFFFLCGDSLDLVFTATFDAVCAFICAMCTVCALVDLWAYACLWMVFMSVVCSVCVGWAFFYPFYPFYPFPASCKQMWTCKDCRRSQIKISSHLWVCSTAAYLFVPKSPRLLYKESTLTKWFSPLSSKPQPLGITSLYQDLQVNKTSWCKLRWTEQWLCW